MLHDLAMFHNHLMKYYFFLQCRLCILLWLLLFVCRLTGCLYHLSIQFILFYLSFSPIVCALFNFMHADSCSSCNKPFKISQSVDCTICFNKFHLKCAGLNKETNYCDWYCTDCLQSIFPFNGIANEDEFMYTVYCYGHMSASSDVMDRLNQIVYNPFVYDRKRTVLNNVDIDPDMNYFNTEINNNCTYFLPDEFNDIIRARRRPNTQGRFSLMHMNCRSLLCNFDDIVDFICSLSVLLCIRAQSSVHCCLSLY